MPLQKVLRLQDLVAYGLGGTIGAGIFVSIGVGAVQSGPALCLSFLLASVACSISALCYCEMAAKVPASGSSYSYTLAFLGRFPAFVIGAVVVIDCIISAAACARAWSAYLRIILPFLPASVFGNLTSPGFEHVFSFSLLAGLLCIILGFVMVSGIKHTTTFNNISTVLNVIVLAIFVLVGLPMMDSANWTPFAPNGVQGIVRGAGRIFFAFLGFDVVNCLAEETAGDSTKALVPQAILWTISLTTLVYILVSVSFVGLAPISSIDLSSPLSSAFAYRSQSVLAYLVGIGAVGNTLTSVLSNFMIQPRIIIKMASDGFFPSKLAEVDNNGVPTRAVILTVSLSALTAFFVDFETLADMVSVASLVSLSVVCVCVLVSRASGAADRRQFNYSIGLFAILSVGFSLCLLHEGPLWLTLTLLALVLTTMSATTSVYFRLISWGSISDQGFKVPLCPVLPLCGIFANTYLLIGLPALALIRACIVFVLCAVFYVWKLRHMSRGVSEIEALKPISSTTMGNAYDSLQAA